MSADRYDGVFCFLIWRTVIIIFAAIIIIVIVVIFIIIELSL